MLIIYKGQCEGRKLPLKLVHVVCKGRVELIIELSGCDLLNHVIYTIYILSLLEDVILCTILVTYHVLLFYLRQTLT